MEEEYKKVVEKHSYLRRLPTPASIIDVRNMAIVWANEAMEKYMGQGEYYLLKEEVVDYSDTIIIKTLTSELRFKNIHTDVTVDEMDFWICYNEFISEQENNKIKLNVKHFSSVFGYLFTDFPAFMMAINVDDQVLVYANHIAMDILKKEVVAGKTCKEIFGKTCDDCDICSPDNKNNELMMITFNNRFINVLKVKDFYMQDKRMVLVAGLDITGRRVIEDHILSRMNLDPVTKLQDARAGLTNLDAQVRMVKNGVTNCFSVAYAGINDIAEVTEHLELIDMQYYIRNIVGIIKHTMRQSDFIYRMETNVLMLIFPGCRKKMAMHVLSMIMKKLDARNAASKGELPYSISYGLAEVDEKSELDSRYIVNLVENQMARMMEEREHRRAEMKRRRALSLETEDAAEEEKPREARLDANTTELMLRTLNTVRVGEHTCVSVCRVNVSDFAYANRTYGKDFAEEYLENVTSIVKSSIRRSDISFKMADDVFMLLFIECPYKAALSIMNIMSKKVVARNKAMGDSPFEYSISYGIHEVTKASDLTLDAVLAAVVDSTVTMTDEEAAAIKIHWSETMTNKERLTEDEKLSETQRLQAALEREGEQE
ncbi:hypothetical protein AGMMS49975_04460 [Clostridia bacterium]|nr:hypothetical protein AGMMS49975_04460 [Clostridia bacterium]